MPELPEVETIIRRLKDGTTDLPSVQEQVIQSVEVTWTKTIAEPDPVSFQQGLVGKKITTARRRGKFLHFPLDGGHLIAHLRMSGDMRMEEGLSESNPSWQPNPYDRVILQLTSAYCLVFSDVRKFGRVWYVDDPQKVLGGLGPEPLEPEFTPEILHSRLQTHARQVKPLLLDQAFIAGLGNIYTDEALFRAKIHPLRSSNTIRYSEAERLHQAIQDVLSQGIRRFGASLDWFYRGGEFQNDFNAYGQAGEPCPVCGTTIAKIRVGQRGTHYCPKCQKLA